MGVAVRIGFSADNNGGNNSNKVKAYRKHCLVAHLLSLIKTVYIMCFFMAIVISVDLIVIHCSCGEVVGRIGFEPMTQRLRASCSTN